MRNRLVELSMVDVDTWEEYKMMSIRDNTGKWIVGDDNSVFMHDLLVLSDGDGCMEVPSHDNPKSGLMVMVVGGEYCVYDLNMKFQYVVENKEEFDYINK